MAAVDSLLRLIPTRNAEALTITANAVPELRKAGAPAPLSMPPLSAAIVAGFLREVGGLGATRYCTDDGAQYTVRVEGSGESVSMTFVPAGAGHPAQAPAPAPAVPAPAPTGELAPLLIEVNRLGASDLILSAGSDAWLRIDGAMRAMPGTAMSEAQILEALEVDGDALMQAGSLDFAIVRGRRFRVNVFLQSDGVAAALRPIQTTPPTLAGLHLPNTLQDLVAFRSGLVLVAGTAGSGKSTTLAALIEHLNQTTARHIITLEDPIEYEYQNRKCLIHQREIGAQVPSFASGLRAALRESPDVILVGEMRDQATMAAAITAAETGHLVLATIHANSATVAIDRMIDVFPANQQRQIRFQVASTLRATLTQFLLESPLPPGRTPAIELMRTTDAIAANIRDDKSFQIPSAIQTGRKFGMIPLEQSLAQLVRERRVDLETALDTAKEPDYLRELLASQA